MSGAFGTITVTQDGEGDEKGTELDTSLTELRKTIEAGPS